MCGFAGVLRLLDRSPEWDSEVIGRTLRHRGPDDQGHYWDHTCGLVHCRLSIIDLSKMAHQPMTNEKGDLHLVYNGELYNFQDLRRRFELDAKGHHFISRTDSEVLIHLYEELGIDFLRHCNGMFAFAIWDQSQQQLHLARDPFGIKPLFYMFHRNAVWFASEIKALLNAPGFTPRPSLEALHHYLSFDYVPGPLTAFAEIYELRPGYVLTFTPGNESFTNRRFFDITYEVDHSMDEKDAIRRSRQLLTEAMERQLVSDVPVGVMLSGGMDSSALTALMAQIRGDSDFHTFSIGFNEADYDESVYAKIVADHVGTHHHQVFVTADQVRQLLPKYLCYIDEPYADGSAIPTYLLAEMAKDFVTVLLSGEGGDEFFSGYDTHLAYKMRRFYRWIPGWIRQGLIRPLMHGLPVSHNKLSFDFKAKRFTDGAEQSIEVSHFSWRAVLSESAKKTVLAEPERFAGLAASEQFFIDAYIHCRAQDELNRLLYIDFSYHLPDDLMIKNDRMTMAHSLEARVPFTDNELVRFLASVPVKYKLKGMRKKHLLRAGLQGLLPERILNKKKIGLEIPYSQWLRQEMRDLSETYFATEKLQVSGLFNPSGVQSIWHAHLNMKVDHGRFLWGLLNYLLWYEAYIEKGDFRSYFHEPRRGRTPPR